MFAPPLEAAIMENPVLEPIYLWNGAFPMKALRNKFLEGQPVKVDSLLDCGEKAIGPFQITAIHLPGHSYSQCGILVEEIFMRLTVTLELKYCASIKFHLLSTRMQPLHRWKKSCGCLAPDLCLDTESLKKTPLIRFAPILNVMNM